MLSERDRVAEMVAIARLDLADVPDGPAKEDTIDRIEDCYIELMAVMYRGAAQVDHRTSPEEAINIGRGIARTARDIRGRVADLQLILRAAHSGNPANHSA